MRIRSDDIVMVMAGNDRGKRGKVLRVVSGKKKVLVEGVNRVYKHVRRSDRNPQGGRLSKEMPVDLSNVMLICGSCGQPSKMGARLVKDGSKERYCKECGAGNGQIAPPRTPKEKS